jgi:hypothetical protein
MDLDNTKKEKKNVKPLAIQMEVELLKKLKMIVVQEETSLKDFVTEAIIDRMNKD